MAQVFISYSRKDLAFVEKLASDLKAVGLDVWYDLSGLEVGSRWGKEIQNAIHNSQYAIVVLSPHSVESEWVEREFLLANNLKIKIIPLLHEACNLPLWALNLHYIDMQGKNYEARFSELLKALGGKYKEAASAEKTKSRKTPRPSQKPTIRPEWILVPAVLIGLTAFVIWGLPPILANMHPTAEPTAEPSEMPTSEPVAISTPAETIASVPSNPTNTFIPTWTPTPSPTNTFTPTWTPTPSPTKTFTPTRTPTSSATSTLMPGAMQISEKDGMAMLYVPAGPFTMGYDEIEDSLPIHILTLDAFWIDQTEVTNGMYAKCVQAGVCEPIQNTSSFTREHYYGSSAYSNYPVIFVNWYMAKNYCTWAGRRLPTEAEWEKAARGTDGRTYPWGENIDCTRANYGGCGVGDTSPVRSYLGDKSFYGAYDMGGNVQEWVSSLYMPYPYNDSDGREDLNASGYRVMRGGAWVWASGAVESAFRGLKNNDPAKGGANAGFRCALSANP